MTKTITVTNYLGGCPTCGANDGCVNVSGSLICCTTRTKSHGVLARIHEIGPARGTQRKPREQKQIHQGLRGSCPVPEGTWPADPEVRHRESRDASQKLSDEEQRQERLYIERCEKVCAFVADALTPFAADMPSNEQIRIRVERDTELILSATGVRRQRADDLPF